MYNFVFFVLISVFVIFSLYEFIKIVNGIGILIFLFVFLSIDFIIILCFLGIEIEFKL